MIAIDWSHTKDLTTFDGKKVRVETLKQLLSRISKDGGESKVSLESNINIQPPSVVLEQGCPMSLIYNIVKVGATVALIDNKATARECWQGVPIVLRIKQPGKRARNIVFCSACAKAVKENNALNTRG